MDSARQQKLKAKGWKFGDAADFLQLSPEQEMYVELRVALSQSLKKMRTRQGISQQRLAEVIGSSQSRVAKMEAGSASVSMDLIVKSMIALGASRKDLARAIGSRSDTT